MSITTWETWAHMDTAPAFTTVRKPFADAMKALAKAAAGKSTLPVLEHVHITAVGDVIRLSATDLHIGVSIQLPAVVEQEGMITLPAKLLSEIVSNFLGEMLVVTSDKQQCSVQIVCGKQRSTLAGIDAEEFPTLPETGEASTAFSASEFMGALNFVKDSASTDDSRPVLSGVCITFFEGRWEVGGADGFRLHHITAVNPTPITEGYVIVPKKSVEYLMGALDPKGDMVIAIGNDRSLLTVTQANLRITTRLIDGRFPDVARIIPQQHLLTFTVDVKAILEELKLARIAAAKSQNVLRLQVEPKRLVITANAVEIKMDYAGELPIEALNEQGAPMPEGETSLHAVNVNYLEDALSVITTKQAAFFLQTSQSPVLVREHQGHSGAVVVIMPMSLNR